MLLPFAKKTPVVAETAFLADSAQVIGDVEIGEESSLWFQVVVRGDVNHIRIGHRTNIQDGTVVHVSHRTHPTRIGDDVTVGHNVTLHGCTIGNRCLIGMGAIVMDGAVIEDDAMIAAGALVVPGTVVRSGTLYAGSPAREKRSLTEAERAFLLQSAQNYLRYADQYRD
ncbi:MAG: gamma carbonic anhydrase family protein [Desulfuromonas sp.]|nr:MAG: gamma carbonic anhydrase family protein [Desulfuromonas sp.]